MADDLTIKLRLIDEFSQAAGRVKDSLKGLRRDAEETTKATGNYRDSMGGLRGEHGKFVTEAGRAGGAARGFRDDVFSLSGAMKAATGIMATVGIGKAAKDLVTLGISTASTRETLEVAFTTLMKSGSKAKDEMAWLTKTAAATPFELNDLTKADRTLLGFGMTADDTRRKFLLGMGDMASSVGVSNAQFSDFSRVFGQIHASGKLMTQDANQLVNYGVGYDVMARSVGRSVKQLRDDMSEGKVSSAEFEAGMQKLFESEYSGGMERQSKTLAGKFSTLKDNIALTMSDLFMPMLPALGTVLDQVGAGFAEWVGKIPGWVQQARDALSPLWDPLVSVWESVVRPLLEKAGSFLKDQLGGSGATTARDVVKGIADGLKFVAEHADAAQSAVVGLTGALTVYKVGSAIATGIAAVVKSWQAYKFAVEGATIAQWLLNVAQAANPMGIIIVAVMALVGSLVYFFTQTETGRKLWEQFTDALGKGWDWVVEKVSQGKDWIVEHWNALWEAGENLVNNIKEKWAELTSAISNSPVGQAFSTIKDKISEFIKFVSEGGIQKALSGIWDGITNKVTEVKDSIGKFFSDLGNFAKYLFSPQGAWDLGHWIRVKAIEGWNALAGFGTMIRQFFSELPSRISSALDMARDWIVNKFNEAKDWSTQKVSELAQNLLNFFANLPANLAALASMARDWIVTKFGEAKDWAIQKVTELGQNLLNFFTSLPEVISAGLTAAKDFIVGKFTEAKDLAVQKGQELISWFQGLPQAIADGLASLPQKLLDNLVKPIQDKVDAAKNKLGEIGGGIADWGRGLVSGVTGGDRPEGDTPHSVGAGSFANTAAAYRRMVAPSGLTVSNIWTGGGGRGFGSGDHQAGRALDLVGPLGRMESFVSRARGAGDFAQLHGSGPTRHVHYVPLQRYSSPDLGRIPVMVGGPAGDTATSVAGAGVTYNISIPISGVSDPRAAAEAAVELLERRLVNAHERR